MKFRIPDDTSTDEPSFEDTICAQCSHLRVCHFLYALSDIADSGVVAVVAKCAHFVPSDAEENEEEG
tara:strand:+ start:371 stop:571 length:201 start_codon:yes stop_codon:yes gene_type:complete